MTNQLNPIQTQPVSLLSQTASFIIVRDLQNSQNVDHDIRIPSFVNGIFEKMWLGLKYSPQGLEHIMSHIEISFIQDQQKSRNITFSPEESKNILTNNMEILFKKLAEKFEAKKIFGNHIPMDTSSYERLQSVWEDEALQKIWDLRLAQLCAYHGPIPTPLNGIKAWLKDPANATQLNGIQTLNLSRLGLKAIPPEISALTQLQILVLSDNQISILSDSLSSFSQLQELHLGNNLISGIPNSLSKLSELQWLSLDNNQISIIPNSLGSLPKLQRLSLCSNQLSIIPDSLSKLSQLEWLYLSNNKIIRIPDSINNLSQLKGLYLDCNQIVSIPDSLSDLSQLQALHFQNNQVNNIPDSFKKLSQLWLVFYNNPLLFIYDNNPLSNILQLVAQCSEFKEYKCLSSFSNLCQLMVQKSDDHQMIKEAFGNLKKNDQNLIFEMVYKVSGVHSNEDPIFWGECHVFDDMNIFCHAVKKAIAAKFDRLSLKEQNAVYEEIDQLARPETEGPEWGEQHAFDNVLRLIDAMDRIE
jgi:Leucine-rich repeat (LRR) protein